MRAPAIASLGEVCDREENAMRALRVLGLAEEGDNLVCQDATSGELFTIPADERLRAAARGDLSRLGQLEIELEPQLRPREIQERIRAGASVAQVAAAASTSISRIERYAYPILLERSTMAEKARLSHPMMDGNPTRKTLEELVLGTLAERGHHSGVQWDAYRDDTGSWVVVLTWQVGRSENHAHWEIRTGPRTNTLKPRDDAARDLINPAPRPLHTITEPSFVDVARRITAGSPPVHERPTAGAPSVTATAAAPSEPGAESARTVPNGGSRHPAGTRRAMVDRLEQEQMVEQTVLDDRAGMQPPPAAKPEVARTGTENSAGRGHRKGGRPVMPGWEDVLLGGGQST
jgi:hypothetical protein